MLGWGVLQSGQWGALTQRSGAGAIEAGFQPKGLERVRPWFRTGYYYSSGDGNPADSTHGTFFAVLPTPRLYARFPFFNSMNNRDVFGEVILRPTKNFTVRSDVHGLWLASSKDLWYTGGGAFQPWTFGYNGRPSNGASKLANLYDISGDYNVAARNFHRAVLRLGARRAGDQSDLSRERQRRAGLYGIQLPILGLSFCWTDGLPWKRSLYRSYIVELRN